MKFHPKEYTLKTGQIITVRNPRIDEAQQLLDLKRAYIKSTQTIPLTIDEYPNDSAHEEKLISEYNESQTSLLLIADYGGELIGNIDITASPRLKMAHTAMLGMGIKETWRNKGLGRALIESAIIWAKKKSTLELIWLDVYASNDLGYNLYINTGFKVSGRIKNFFKEAEENIDKIQMYQHLK